ncbi:MAG: hypothetical protein ABEN55_14070, partial [Bradymonadaceae bacterium]
GVDSSGNVTCATDQNTTYDGSDFALSNQGCSSGDVVTGVDSSGNVTCAADQDTTYSGGSHISLSGTTINAQDDWVNESGDTMSGDLKMGGHRIRNTSPAVKTTTWGNTGTGSGWGTVGSVSINANAGEAIQASAFVKGNTDCGGEDEGIAFRIVVDGTVIGISSGHHGSNNCIEAKNASGLYKAPSSGTYTVKAQTADAYNNSSSTSDGGGRLTATRLK